MILIPPDNGAGNCLNISLKDLEKKINKKTKAIVLVHVLGNSVNMKKLKRIISKYKIKLIEDACESLGSKFERKYLGSFGEFGTYSFYYYQLIYSKNLNFYYSY